MKERRLSLSLLALAPAAAYAQTLPYNPTRLFFPKNSTYVYVVGPSSNAAGLSALNLAASFDSTSPHLSTITQTLPLLQNGDDSIPYTPTMDPSGNITVIGGKCDAGPKDTNIWQFQPNLGSSSAQGTWTQYKTVYQVAGNSADYASPGYLGNSITYSTIINGTDADSSIYLFGGMCPFDNSTADTWVSRADYSDALLTISPGASNYDLGEIASRESPISQAGFSITPLPAAYSVNSAGVAQTQQQNFVLLGGNTQSAFINMSQVALFSLPQQTWSFIEVSQPASGGKADLAVKRSVQQVTPRSGHTAIYSESTNSIILLGGWVGNVNTPAQPQLAILELGAGYGGTGDWRWTIPDQSSFAAAGIYGHGATMLPGGVMLVLGGYEITTTSSKWRKRGTEAANTRAYLYNTTSGAFLTSWDPPASLTQLGRNGGGALSNTSQKVGLGTGLGVGAALLVTVVVFYLWYGKRLERQREQRQRTLLAYSSDGSALEHTDPSFLYGGVEGRTSDEVGADRLWSNREMTQSNYPRLPPLQHSTGAFVNVPSPTRGLRKGSGSRNYQYHAPPQFDDKGLVRGTGAIHPIAEDENEDDQRYMSGAIGGGDPERTLWEIEQVLAGGDPFRDNQPETGDTVRRVPTNASRIPSSPSRPGSRGLNATNWIAEEEEDGMEEDGVGFTTSHGDDRTSSTLSEGSIISAYRIPRKPVGSQRPQGGTPHGSPTRERSSTTPNRSGSKMSYFKTRTRSSTNGSLPLSPGEDDASFITVKSNFYPAGHAENDALLSGPGGGAGTSFLGLDGPYQRAIAAQPLIRTRHPIPAPRRRPGLLGSLRRALNVVSLSDRSFSLTSGTYDEGMRSTSSSPTKHHPSSTRGGAAGPRRAVSDGGTLLRSKRGQQDWDEKEWPPYRDDPAAADWGEPAPPARSSAEIRQLAEEDWDVEGAAKSRDFQVMFSVPKARLRVVNDDMDRASLRSASDGAISRSGSLRARDFGTGGLGLLRKGSVRLPSTEEEEGDGREKM
ncbi:hypothetical protein BDY17DRAFT_326993 [Neohortaea acidophila]|uniref:Galactose oxidase n=1 Tax=Neohortaea acidophila TaxID=245834 RepID=A0A6A6PJN9_9PEZI|nr:uncharacterized protein BDY17DRAFT_326993 [Neohortaea acidophila]KAF2480006.1 hypothetical protein BDY17DRAFT_326993 [Neohortaea acidophila]